MTRHATLGVAAVVVLLLSCVEAQGQTVIIAMLNGQNQSPPINTLASGTFKIDQGTNGNLTFSLVLTGVENMTMAHIHSGGAGTSGPVVLPLVPLPSDDTDTVGGLAQLARPLSASQGSPIRIMGAINPANFSDSLEGKTADEFITEMATGDYYVNVHTVDEPGGLIRGQTAPNMANATMPGAGGGSGMMSPPMMSSSPGGVAPTPSGGSGTPSSSAPAFQAGVAAVAAVAAAVAALL